MLAKRIIPCLDVEKGRVVKGTKFLELVDAGDPVVLQVELAQLRKSGNLEATKRLDVVIFQMEDRQRFQAIERLVFDPVNV